MAKPALLTWSTEYATDIKDAYPDKPVTLLHSRERVLPKFHPSMHDQSTALRLFSTLLGLTWDVTVVQRMSDLGIDVILGERLDLSSVPTSALNTTQEHTLRTVSGREIRASLVASTCTYPTWRLADTSHSYSVQAKSQIRNYCAMFFPTPSLQMAQTRGTCE